MDSSDRSNNQLKAPDSGFGGGFRSQSFSNLFQGFFGVKHAPTSATSTTDITASDSEDKPPEGKSLETIVSPSNDDSWILSHFLQAKREKEYDRNMRRNVTWSGLGQLDPPHVPDSVSSASSTTDVTQTEVPRIRVADDESSGSELREKSDELTKTKVVVAKNAEHPYYQRKILSSFLAHDLPHSEVRQNEQVDELQRSQPQVNTRITQATVSTTVEATGVGDKPDGGLLLPGAMPSGDRIESKQTLRDFLWSFNHEKINVSKKEMNLIASIDQ